MSKKDKKKDYDLMAVPERGYIPTSHEHRRIIWELNDFIVAVRTESEECDRLTGELERIKQDRDGYKRMYQEIRDKHEIQKQKAENLSFWLPAVSVFAIGCLVWMSVVLSIHMQK